MRLYFKERTFPMFTPNTVSRVRLITPAPPIFLEPRPKNTLPFGVSPNQHVFDRFKQTKVLYPRMRKIFPSLAINPNRLPQQPLDNKTHLPPFINPIEENTHYIKTNFIKNECRISHKDKNKEILQSKDEIGTMDLGFRAFPDHVNFVQTKLIVAPAIISNMKKIWESLSMHKLCIPVSSHGVELYTRAGTGLKGLVSKRKQFLIETVTFHKGTYARILVLVSLGFGCTVWYVFAPGVADISPPVELFPINLDYRAFCNESFVHPKFQKLHFIETKYLYGEVLKAFENVYPFNQIEIPQLCDLSQASTSASTSQASTSASTSQIVDRPRPSLSLIGDSANKKCAISLGLMISIFVATEVLVRETPKIIEMTI